VSRTFAPPGVREREREREREILKTNQFLNISWIYIYIYTSLECVELVRERLGIFFTFTFYVFRIRFIEERERDFKLFFNF